jgi:hypothetical protein
LNFPSREKLTKRQPHGRDRHATKSLDAFDGIRNFLFTRLRKADAHGEFEVNGANMVKASSHLTPRWREMD